MQTSTHTAEESFVEFSFRIPDETFGFSCFLLAVVIIIVAIVLKN